MLEALIALGGVILGAAITGGVSLWLEHQRDRKDVRTAARLLLERFQIAWDAVDHDYGDPFLGYLDGKKFEASEWEEVRRIFARHLDDETMKVVTRGIRQLDADRGRSRRLFDRRFRDDSPPDNSDVNASLTVYRRTMIPLKRLATSDLRPWPQRLWHRFRPPTSPGADADHAALMEEVAELRATRAAEREASTGSADEVSS